MWRSEVIMQTPHEPSAGDRLGQEDREVRAAIRFAVVATVVSVAFLALAALWVSTCGAAEAVDTVACGRPQRMILALGAPVILFLAGLRAFARTYRVWRGHGTWWGWHGAGWFLLMVMLLTLTTGTPLLAGPLPG